MEIILSILLLLTKILDFFTTPLFNFKARNTRQHLPPLKNDLLMISATQLAHKIRKKQVSSEELCQVYIERIKDVNPILNAVVQDRFRDALREAKQVDSYLHTTSLSVEELEKFKPLLGVPVTIKESCSVKGMSFCVGLRSRIGYKAENDGEAVARIRSCGAIVLLVSTTPELSLAWETFSFINGYTKNPYDSTCTSGGSSGGEGALIGAGASVIGLGADIAGSIRLPAHFNGVFGHKPTPKIISIKGHWPFLRDERYNEFLVIGPLVRYANDLKLMMNVLCGNKLSTELRLNEPVDLKKLKIFFMEDVGYRIALQNVSKEIKVAIRKSVQHLNKTCGAEVEDYKFEEFKYAQEICGSTIFGLKDIPNAMKWHNTNFFMDFLKLLFGKSNCTLNLIYFYALETIYKYCVSDYSTENVKLKSLLLEKLGINGIIIFPTYIGPAHKHHQIFFKCGYAYLLIANALGLPATSIPCGFSKNGLPIGIQVMAAPNQDRLCLAVAEELERCFGGWIPPSK